VNLFYSDSIFTMKAALKNCSVSASDVSATPPTVVAEILNDQSAEILKLKRHVDWFNRQLFGQKSEKRMLDENPAQGSFDDAIKATAGAGAPPADKQRTVAGHVRTLKPRGHEGDETASAFFDESRVPFEDIAVPNPAINGLDPAAYTVIGEKVSFRLAQRPGSYVVLRYTRPVIKLNDTQAISCPAAPAGVLEGSRADVSFLAGMIVDKLAYHLPLYRLHQRLQDAGFKVSRPWLTQLVQRAATLLEPINDAQLESIRRSRVKAMDETPIKAGRSEPGKMKNAYFWPVYGMNDEICFLYYPGRSARHVQEALGLSPPPGSVLLTDGYSAYEAYARKSGIAHAQCWSHGRRHFEHALDIEPERANEALDMIGGLYLIEARLREQGITGDAKRTIRQAESRPVVDRFFDWVDERLEAGDYLPSSPLTKALGYVRERRKGLEVFLDDPDVQIDTNHLERTLRAIPMGRKSWNFCWTELGARHIGIMQSLITTCKLHDINPYEYLVDVLQRVEQHPMSRVEELTPRRWKELFARDPLRSDLHWCTNKPVA